MLGPVPPTRTCVYYLTFCVQKIQGKKNTAEDKGQDWHR